MNALRKREPTLDKSLTTGIKISIRVAMEADFSRINKGAVMILQGANCAARAASEFSRFPVRSVRIRGYE